MIEAEPEFLKKLDLPERKSTSISTIQEELRNNGSPKQDFLQMMTRGL